jgi:drug/metabolite transporter (DMT)-like permease
MTARGWWLFALMSVLWGVPYLMIKVAVEGVSPSGVVAVRCALGAALLLPFALRQRGMARTLRAHWRPMLAFAVAEIIVPWWTLTDAERGLTSSTAGLLIAAVPIIGVLLARPFGQTERLDLRRCAGLALGVAGVAVLTAGNVHAGDTRALVEVLLTAVGYATAPLITARYLTRVPTLHLVVPCLALAAVVYAPAAALGLPHGLPGPRVWVALAGLGVICTACAFVGFLELIREVGPTRSMVFTYVNPAVAVAAGVVFLGEDLTAGVAAAFALILLGSFLATSAPRTTASVTVAASAGPVAGGERPARRVPWPARQTSRPGGRVEPSPSGSLPEERPGSTGQGGG